MEFEGGIEVKCIGRWRRLVEDLPPEHVFDPGGGDEVYEFDRLNSVCLALTPWSDARELSECLGGASRVAVL